MAEKKKNGERTSCPYCEEEIIEKESPYCQACGVKVFYCPSCRKPVERTAKTCPSCGTDIRSSCS